MYLTASLIQAYGVHQRSRREQKYVYTPPKKIPHSYDQYIDYGIFSKVKKSYSTHDVNNVLIIIYYLYVYVIAVKGSCKDGAKKKPKLKKNTLVNYRIILKEFQMICIVAYFCPNHAR